MPRGRWILPRFVSVLCGSVLAALPATSATVRVPSDVLTIQGAIDECIAGDTVLVAAGTYAGDGNRDLTFRGKDLVLLSESGPEATIIDVGGEDMHRAIAFRDGATRAAVLEGFTLQNGRSWGSAVSCFSASPTIRHCILRDCPRSSVVGPCSGGGGIACEGSAAPLITGCEITGNYGDEGGGILCCDQSSPTIEDCLITNNLAGVGGGIACYYEAGATVRRCRISGNCAQAGGGVFAYTWGAVLLDHVEITDNWAYGTGGGLSLEETAPGIGYRLQSCTVSRNTASRDGGGIWCYGWATLEKTIVSGNCSPRGSDLELAWRMKVTCCALADSGVYREAGSLLVVEGEQVTGDPLFCGPPACASGMCEAVNGDFRLRSDSPCLAARSPCGETIGAYDEGCAPPSPEGACCLSDTSCVLATAEACQASQGRYSGDGTGCGTVHCQDTPVEKTTWGRIKAQYSSKK